MMPSQQVDVHAAEAIEAADKSLFMGFILEKLGEIPGWLIFGSIVGLLGIWLWRRKR